MCGRDGKVQMAALIPDVLKTLGVRERRAAHVLEEEFKVMDRVGV